MEIHELGLFVRDLRMLRIVMDLHGLEIRSRDFGVRTLELSVTTFLFPGPIGYSRLSSASVGQRSIDLGLNLLSCMLLRLGLASHLRW